MEIIICDTAEAASELAAAHVAAAVSRKPDLVLGLATGSTPLALYRHLADLHGKGRVDFSGCSSFNLDEYVGLGPDHPASYSRFMRDNFFSKVNFRPGSTRIPDGLAADIPAHCLDYERAIAGAGGIDLQILGIGSDGHIGFNEPTSSLASRTRIKTLTDNTRRDNARFFASIDEVPHHVITMGIGTILDARCALLLAFGESKAAAIAATAEGPVTAMVPASALQLHPCAKLLLDEAAASALQKRDYYRQVFDNKPGWQRV